MFQCTYITWWCQLIEISWCLKMQEKHIHIPVTIDTIKEVKVYFSQGRTLLCPSCGSKLWVNIARIHSGQIYCMCTSEQCNYTKIKLKVITNGCIEQST